MHTFVILWRLHADVVLFYELLLFGNHILEVNYCARLQLQVQQQLHVLALEEVVLNHELQEVAHVLVYDALVDRTPDRLDLLVVLIQLLLHRLPLYQILFRAFI
jgi:hypothetical protein